MNTLPHPSSRAPARHERHRRRERLAVTLLVTVLVKCAVLYGLWAAFFSHPQTRHMLLPAAQVERHLFSSPSTNQ